MDSNAVLELFRNLNQHEDAGGRSPHKPLLILVALAHLRATGNSELAFSEIEGKLKALIEDYRPPRKTPAQPANPFTRLESAIWHLSDTVTKDSAVELRAKQVTGRFAPEVELALRNDDQLAQRVARMLVDREFADSQLQDVLIATGLGDIVATGSAELDTSDQRKRSSSWPSAIVTAWNKTCAFCGYSGMLGAATVGLEAAHVRWFKKGGPDEMDNGLALCALDHKLLDTGVLGVTQDYRIKVAREFTGVASAGERVLQLHDRRLTSPKPGTPLPNPRHIRWHDEQVFKSPALTE